MSTPIAINAADLLTDGSGREFILLAGKDGTGKTNALISLAEFISQMDPTATFYIIDTENKVRPVLQAYGRVPANIVYFQCEGMNDVTAAFEQVMEQRKPGDWLGVESAGRIWERAQDLGYNAIKGLDKAAYMERRRIHNADKSVKPLPVTPSPDELWSVIKGAHDGAFLDIISQTNDLNCIITTGVARVKEQRSNRKENVDRVEFRQETGIDLNLDGAPRLPYYIYTGVLLERQNGQVSARIWRDNGSKLDDPAITFAVPTKRDFAMQFYTETGRL